MLSVAITSHAFLRGSGKWSEGLHAIIGPSGSGKTTLMRLLAGLGQQGPTIEFGSAIWQNDSHSVPPYLRPIAYVPQHPSLIPFRTVRHQISWVMTPSAYTHVSSWAERLEIASLLDRHPRALSGGQQQRVAILRALATGQPVLLLDEALSQVEDRLRQQCLEWFKRERPVAWLFYSTHRLEEALEFGDTLTVIHDGYIYSPSAPSQLLNDPPNQEIALMLGYRGSLRLADHRYVLLHPARLLAGAYPELGLVHPARVDICPLYPSLGTHWTITSGGDNPVTWEWDLPQYPHTRSASAITIIHPTCVSYSLNGKEA